jgi:hypothetical protein
MDSFNLPEDLIKRDNGESFLVLGQHNVIFDVSGTLNNEVSFRLDGLTNDTLVGFWGTLGREDGVAPDWAGTIYCSGEGNITSTGDTAKQISYISQWQVSNPAFKDVPVVERFVAFDGIQFGNSEESRKLRLTLMLDASEAAILYYHHGQPGGTSNDGEVEYILPAEGNSLDEKPGRKTFLFEVPSFFQSDTEIDDGNAALSRFLVKALVFKSDGQAPLARLRSVETYGFVRYNVGALNGFEDINCGDIDFSKKTLLLLHGTFATTRGSFRGLHDFVSGGATWFQNVMTTVGYEQIIGFDHKTISDDADTNVSEFKQYLAAANAGWKFEKPVDVITTSRGGLVGKTMCNDVDLNGTEGRMLIEKVATVSCANGAALLDPQTGAPGIRMLLSLIACIPFPPVEVIFSLLQLTYDVLSVQPGILVETPGTPSLQKILDGKPGNSRTRYYPVCGIWDSSKLGAEVLSKLLNLLLHDPNDGVNYKQRMILIPANTAAYGYDPTYFIRDEALADAFHTMYFTTAGETRPQTYIQAYLGSPGDTWLSLPA